MPDKIDRHSEDVPPVKLKKMYLILEETEPLPQEVWDGLYHSMVSALLGHKFSLRGWKVEGGVTVPPPPVNVQVTGA